VAVIPATRESTNRRMEVQANLGIKQDPISKITNAKRSGGVTEQEEYLPCKCKTLSSIPVQTHTHTHTNIYIYVKERIV
jgi:hypothetical protein